MARDAGKPSTIDGAHLALLSDRILLVPGNLAAIELGLRRLAEANGSRNPAGSSQTIVDACRSLQRAIAEVVEAAEYINAWLEADGRSGVPLAEPCVESGWSRPERVADRRRDGTEDRAEDRAL